MKRSSILTMIFFCCVFSLSAQDPQFSQFYASPLYLGPSMAGTSNGSRLCFNFRDQWPRISGKYVTYALSADKFFSRYNSGAGILLLRDGEGTGKLTTTQVGFNYSYRINVTRDFFLQPGLQALYFNRKVDYSKLTFTDQYYGTQVLPSSVEELPEQAGGHLDFSTSLLGFSKRFWIGFTFDHLMRMSTTLSQNQNYVPIKISTYGGYKFSLKEKLLRSQEQTILVAFNYRNQAHMQQLDLGMYYNLFPITVGIWYRGIPVLKNTQSNDALALSMGVAVSNCTIVYSYDLTVSSLITSTGGAHEISLLYQFEDYIGFRNKKRLGAVPCPKF